MANAIRREPLKGRLYALNGVSLTPAPAAVRISLRVREDGLAAAKKALGFSLPGRSKSTVEKDGVACLWIGPDEWLLIDAPDSGLVEKLAKLGNAKLSAVDISHRNTAVIVAGQDAADVINAGCPQDLSLAVFSIGAASRTILGKAEIILWRTGESEFRIECWRSFSDYVWKFLVDAAKSVDC